jgi:hypothetical protein
MERIAQLIDEIEDLVSVLRHRFGFFPAARISRRR